LDQSGGIVVKPQRLPIAGGEEQEGRAGSPRKSENLWMEDLNEHEAGPSRTKIPSIGFRLLDEWFNTELLFLRGKESNGQNKRRSRKDGDGIGIPRSILKKRVIVRNRMNIEARSSTIVMNRSRRAIRFR
jgi:hypothetical protein